RGAGQEKVADPAVRAARAIVLSSGCSMPASSPSPQDEELCPECGQPKLRGWGSTCGVCRAPLGQLREAELVARRRPGAPSLALAWLVVVDCPDAGRNGEVIPLPAASNVITREGAVTGLPGEVVLRDDFLSAGHAQIRVELTGDLRFVLEDRRDPGPS